MIQRKRGRRKKRVCASCADKVTVIDYKDISKLCKASESFNNSYQESKTRCTYALYTGLI